VLDRVHAFFLNCNHLADWLDKDPNTSLSMEAGNLTRDSSSPLCTCRLLVNGQKHYALGAGGQQIGSGSVAISNADVNTLASSRHAFSISWQDAGQTHSKDAVHLAEECMAARRTLLQGHSLIEPTP
jgi:hypothetical protein